MPWQGLDRQIKRVQLMRQIQIAKFAEDDIAPQGLKVIDDRTRAGKFLGGILADKGYSTRWIPAWFGRNFKISKSKDGKAVYSFGSTRIPTSAIAWRRKAGAKPIAYLTGGYKQYRSILGRKTDRVDLTMSGRMLRALDAKVVTSRNNTFKNSVLFYVRKPQDKIAEYNHAKRQFVGFDNRELKAMQQKIQDFLNESA